MAVGIEKIWAYPCALSLDFDQLGHARGVEPGYAQSAVRVTSRSVNPAWEDPVTMAVNAARPMLTDADRASVELLIAGTESSPDQGKPISTFIHRHLELGENCRNFEVKHACYGGTSALMMAASWIASGAARGKKALVVCTDQSRMNLGVPWEYVMGAGAVAFLISDRPDVLELDLEHNGYWTTEVGDTFRPTSKDEGGNTDQSLYCYLEALQKSYDHYRRKRGAADSNRTFYDNEFDWHVYHMPFAGMAWRAHRTLMRQWGPEDTDIREHFARKVEPSLRYGSQVGGTYTASTFYGLLSLLDNATVQPGDHIGIYSYGSGSCAEFYRGVVGAHATEAVARIRLPELLENRRRLTIAEYEATERERTDAVDRANWAPRFDALNGFWDERYAGRDYLVLRKVDGFFREYGWS